MQNFTILEDFLTIIHLNETAVLHLAGKRIEVTILSSKEHEEFTKLRFHLRDMGFIKVELNHWNGDRVLKPFSLNGFKFKTGAQFSCASALKIGINCARKAGRDYIL